MSALVSIPDGDSFRREAEPPAALRHQPRVSIPDGGSFRREGRVARLPRPRALRFQSPMGIVSAAKAIDRRIVLHRETFQSPMGIVSAAKKQA